MEYVAEDMLRKYGTQLADTVVVFPNKRASLFLNDYLARKSQQPIWSPRYTTISELFAAASNLTVGDPIKLVCDLHKSYCRQTGSAETLDRFIVWGQLLLSDFDDIDKNMADADRVLANVSDIHELDDTSFLTAEQREALKRFFSNFTDTHDSEIRERFIRLWSRLAAIYHDFNETIAAQGLAYEGSLCRQVIDSINASPSYSKSHFTARRYLFVGFNLLHETEQRLFKALMRDDKAFFYWDFDKYYMKGHEAGHYISQYLSDFPNELDSSNGDIYDNFQSHKDISFVAAATENIQARYIGQWLGGSDGQQRIGSGRRTAVILCDEALLQTVTHSLPDSLPKVNITMGYPLSQTPVASLIPMLFALQTSQYPPRQLKLIRRHPYGGFIDGPLLEQRLSGENMTKAVLSYIAETLRCIATNAGQQLHDPLSAESLFRAYTLINRLHGLAEAGDLQVDIVTAQRLVNQLVQGASIPFHGEPAEGTQIMGVLETRNLDFDHLLLLSCNEGKMPKGVDDSSFIPHSVRSAYGLTTIGHKVAIYSYYFHRLLQRASDITIVYNNSTDDGSTGEKSRFMLQMLIESGHRIKQFALHSGLETNIAGSREIPKTDHILNLLRKTFTETQLTPTAVNRYMRCQLMFYYRYVADIKEPDIDDDEQELDNRVFGNIFHKAAETIYRQLPQHIERDMIASVLKQKVAIEKAVDDAFHEEMPSMPFGGLHLINREVIIHYLQQLLRIDIQLAPFTIIGLECNVKRPVSTVCNGRETTMAIGGWIDRLDLMSDGRIRVVDYKTGGGRVRPLPDVDAIFDATQLQNHSDYYLQTFVYADIVRRGFSSSAYPLCDGSRPVSPALLFIQHAGMPDYDPTLCFGKSPIVDVAPFSDHFNSKLQQIIDSIFGSEEPFRPTNNEKTCQSCPYAGLCRR